MTEVSPRIAVVGPGAIGTAIAYFLNRNGVSPYLVFRNRSRAIRAANSGGLKLEHQGITYSIKGKYLSYEGLPERLELAFIATKAYSFSEALTALLSSINNVPYIVTCQNGLGSFESALKAVGEDKAYALVLNIGVRKVREYEYSLRGIGLSYLGGKDPSSVGSLKDIAKLLNGMNVKVVNNIEPYRWLKLLINASINPITAILQVPNGYIIENPYARKLAEESLREGLDLVSALNINLPADPHDELFRVASSTKSNYSSMAQDIANRRKTEIDYINGALIEIGRKYGIVLPVNSVLYSIVKGLEMKYLTPRSYNQ